MDLKLIQRPDEINIENAQDVKYLSIHYTGKFDGEIFGNTWVWVRKTRIVIRFMSPPEEVLMKYEGNLKIRKIYAYDKERNETVGSLKILNDEIRNITSEIRYERLTYKDYNQSNRYSNIRKTKLRFTLNNTKRLIGDKGRHIRTENGTS